MPNIEKPKLGCPPYYVEIPERIRELSAAIGRATEGDILKNDIAQMAMWAAEIGGLCKLLNELLIMRDDSIKGGCFLL